ncbi:hypothetical protein L2649_12185, partial [Thermoactinomyces vulgaris]|uniref:hypothetical protein n=1 Tax=Thermoactinomyces vulgaris TaxID=2026 RepID=UPI001F24D583
VKTFIVKLYNEGFFVFWNPGVSLYGNDPLATHTGILTSKRSTTYYETALLLFGTLPPKMYAGLEPRRIMKKRI